MCKRVRQFGGVAHREGMVAVLWLAALVCFGLTSASAQNSSGAADSDLKLSQRELMRQFDEASDGEYTLAAGDEIDLQVPTNPDLQGHHVIGPDGNITIPILDSIRVSGQTREAAARAVTTALSQYYTEVHASIQVTKYGSNRVMVVGRVPSPGPIFFNTAPTLLEALAKSGAYGASSGTVNTSPTPMLTRCAIYRGSEEVLWIDMKELFSSGTAVDLHLRRGDIVYVPDDQEQQVSVLGQVRRPGPVTLSPDTRLVDVLAKAGGLTDEAAGGKIRLVRPSTGLTREVAFQDLIKPERSKDTADIALQRGDVIYVPQSGLAKIGYVLQKLSSAGTLLMFGAIAAGR
jgi:polysaccharide biosynthesis/export protein